MRDLPPASVRVSRLFEPVLSERGWDWARVLRVGASVAPGQRTVAAIVWVLGLSEERQFQTYPRVLKRADWSSRAVSRRLLGALVRVFVAADAPVVVELDEQFCGVSAR